MKKLFLIAGLVLSLNSIAQIPPYVPTNGLLGWWPFNGNANDESGNSHNGIVNGGANLVSDRFSINNRAYSFNGTDSYILVANSPNFLTTEYSISIWFFSQGSFCNSNCLFRSGNNLTGCVWQGFGIYDNNSFYGVYDFGNSSVAFGSTLDCNTVQVSQWHNIIFTRDSLIANQYLDGQLVNSVSNSIYEVASSCPIYIGSNHLDLSNQPWNVFNGNVDDIGIWNRVLTEIEIESLFNSCSLSINSQPINDSVLTNNTAQFTIIASDTNSIYQWQTDLGTGFIDITNTGQYSGSTNDTLLVANTSLINDNQNFRCIISAGSCIDTSIVVILTVINNVGVNELKRENHFNVTPNPCTTCEITGAANATDLTVTDILGRKQNASFIKSANGYNIHLPETSTGIFIIRNIKTGEVVKFVRE